MKKYFISGSAGFIGYHLAKSLLNDGFEVYGVDNMNNYYDQKLKHLRIDQLKNYANFSFNEIDITDRTKLGESFKAFSPDKVVNLAAQAGVRYSIENPYAYMQTNLVGFLNMIELCRHNEVDGFIYASSSSVYGGNENYPFSVDDRVDNPISLYAATKKSNELIANAYSHLFELNTTGLRFFTVYGPWGRPDMAMYIFARLISEGKPINVFNNGDMERDFTYIDDIVAGIRSALDRNYRCEIFNLGNNKSEKLLDMIQLIEDNVGIKAKLNFMPMQAGDVRKSIADIVYSKDKLGYEPTTNIDVGIAKFIKWFKENEGVKYGA